MEVQAFVLSAMEDPWWEQRFPLAPVEVDVLRRSRTSTFSAAHVAPGGWDAVIWIRDGSWNGVTVVHELAHVAVCGRASGARPPGPAHGPVFTGALLDLWRAPPGGARLRRAPGRPGATTACPPSGPAGTTAGSGA